MAKVKITDAEIRGMASSSELRDTEISGFSVRKRQNKISFRLVYNSPTTGKRRYYTIGVYGNITATQARDIAKTTAGKVAIGIDPQEERADLKNRARTEQQRTLRAFLHGGFKEVTPEKRWNKASKDIERHFTIWLDKPMDSIERSEAQKWLNDYPGAPAGANRLLNNVRGLLTKAVDAKVISHHPLRGTKDLPVDKKKKKNPLTNAEERRLLDVLDRREDRRRAERLRYIAWHGTRKSKKPVPEPHGVYTDHLKPIVLLVLHTGLRKGEVFNLYVDDIDFDAAPPSMTVIGMDPITERRSKSAQSRHIPLNDIAEQTLRDWIQQTSPNSYVFPSEDGGRLEDIKTALDSVMAEARIKKKKLHALRHTFGTRLVRKKVDLVTIKELMGHSSLETTQGYLHTDDEQKAKAVQLLSSD